MSARYIYKLMLPGGVGRRISLDARPTWDVLASRVHDLFSIPVNDVGLVYVDNDGDEITISSDLELQDYHDSLGRRSPVHYATGPPPSKFIVHNLAISGARRPSSDSSSSGFSFIKHSPAEHVPSARSPSWLPPPLSPRHERGRSASPVFLSESRVTAHEEAATLSSFIRSLVDRPPSHVESDVPGLVSAASTSPGPSQRSRSFSPSFMTMARSPHLNAPRFPPIPAYVPSVRSEVVQDIEEVIPPSPFSYNTRPVSPYYPDLDLPPQPTSPPIIMGGIRGPSTDVPVEYITSEEILNFVTPLSRPSPLRSHRSLSSPRSYTDRLSPRPEYVEFSYSPRCSSRRSSIASEHPPRDSVHSVCDSRAPSPSYFSRAASVVCARVSVGVPSRASSVASFDAPFVAPRTPSVIGVRPPSVIGVRSPSVISFRGPVPSVRAPSRASSRWSRPPYVNEQRSRSHSPAPPCEFAPIMVPNAGGASPRLDDFSQWWIGRSSRHPSPPRRRSASRDPPFQARPRSVSSRPVVYLRSPGTSPSLAAGVLETSEPSFHTTRNGLVKTTLEQLRHVSQGVIASLRQEMEALKDETAQSIQERFEDLKQDALKGAQLSLNNVRTEMDIVKVEARELLELKEKLRSDIFELSDKMRFLQENIAFAKQDLKHLVKEVSQERKSMEEQMQDMISQLQKERALRESEKQAEERAKVHESKYSPRYVSLGTDAPQIHEEAGLEEKAQEERRTTGHESKYNPRYISFGTDARNDENGLQHVDEMIELPMRHRSSPFSPSDEEGRENVEPEVKVEEAEDEEDERVPTRASMYDPVPEVLRPSVRPRPSMLVQNAAKRMTWDGYASFGPVGPLPPLPPPPPLLPPPPPAPAFPGVPGLVTSERRHFRHLPRPPTQEEDNGIRRHSVSDLDGDSNANADYRSPFVPSGLNRANTVGGGRDGPNFIHWGEGGEDASRWGNFHGRHRQNHNQNQNASSMMSHCVDEDRARRGFGFGPHGSGMIPPPPPPPFAGPYGIRRMNSVPSRLNGAGPGRFGNPHWRHSFVPAITENEELESRNEPAPYTTHQYFSTSSVPTPNDDLSAKSSLEGMSSAAARIERVEVEEARKAYKVKKAAWKRQRDEIRKAFMIQAQGSTAVQPQFQPGRVRPFDTMTVPVELSTTSNGNGSMPRMPGALPPPPSRSQTSLPPLPPPPPTPPPPPSHFQQESQPGGQDLSNRPRFGYPSMPGSLPVPPLQGSPQPQEEQTQSTQHRPGPRNNVRWSVQIAPPPGPGHSRPSEHIRPRSVPSPFPQPVRTNIESNNEAVRPFAHAESSDEGRRDDIPISAPPSGSATRVFPMGFQPLSVLTLQERRLKNYVVNKLFSMGFKFQMGTPFDFLVQKEVCDELSRVNGRPHSADTVSMIERLVERLLMDPSFSNLRSRSMSPASRRLIAGMVAANDALTSATTSGAGNGSNSGTNAGSIPGQWNGRDF